MKNRMVQAAIKYHFDKQSIFSDAVGMTELQVSQVIHGRRRLTKAERARWAKTLQTPLRLLFPEPSATPEKREE